MMSVLANNDVIEDDQPTKDNNEVVKNKCQRIMRWSNKGLNKVGK